MKKLILIFFGVLLVVGWFYWFQWRPSNLRKKCHKRAMQSAIDKVAHDNFWYKDDFDVYYEVCLHKEGLK